MFIQRKNFMNELARFRVSEGRDMENGLRLDRNEKVDVWPANMLADVFSSKAKCFLSVYPESTPLYERLAKFHNVNESEILLTSGIDGGLKTLYEIMTEPGDLVGVVSPTYAMYQVYAKIFQVQLEEILYTKDLQFGEEQFEKFLARKPSMFFLPNPNQPVESCFDLAKLEEIAQKTLEANCLFVIDEAYHMFGSVSGVDLIKKYENVVVARTFSKGFGVPSIRLGYLISNPDNMNILSKTRLAHESNSLSNAVAEYLLDNYSMVEAYNSSVISARDEIKIKMKDLDILAIGNNGNFLLLDLKTEERAKRYAAFLANEKIYIKGPWKGDYSKYVTITIGPMTVMERFVDATEIFLEAEV
jgi:histidinol-phosphate aminotransferase